MTTKKIDMTLPLPPPLAALLAEWERLDRWTALGDSFFEHGNSLISFANDAERAAHLELAMAILDFVLTQPQAAQWSSLKRVANEVTALPLEEWLQALPYSLCNAEYPDDAVALSERLLLVFPDENSFANYASVLLRAGRHKEALRQTGQNLERFPHSAWIHLWAGDTYRELDRLDDAEAAYTEAVEIADFDVLVMTGGFAGFRQETGRAPRRTGRSR